MCADAAVSLSVVLSRCRRLPLDVGNGSFEDCSQFLLLVALQAGQEGKRVRLKPKLLKKSDRIYTSRCVRACKNTNSKQHIFSKSIFKKASLESTKGRISFE